MRSQANEGAKQTRARIKRAARRDERSLDAHLQNIEYLLNYFVDRTKKTIAHIRRELIQNGVEEFIGGMSARQKKRKGGVL